MDFPHSAVPGESESTAADMEPRDPKFKHRILTIPTLICFGRLLGSVLLFVLALLDHPEWFVGLFIVLTVSDWIDGRLARWLHQRSDFGARIDSLADAVLYSALIAGCVLLSWDVLQSELWWLGVPVASYILTSGFGLAKFGRVPSYHTWAAKRSQVLVLLAGIALVLDWSVWPLRLAALAVTFTNLEAIAMTYVLSEWRADVPSLANALALQRQSSA